MVRKYSRMLEERDINPQTGEIMKIQDVPATWRAKTEAKVIADGYEFLPDGTAQKVQDD